MYSQTYCEKIFIYFNFKREFYENVFIIVDTAHVKETKLAYIYIKNIHSSNLIPKMFKLNIELYFEVFIYALTLMNKVGFEKIETLIIFNFYVILIINY